MSPHEFEAVIFDLDGVITQTATLHARAWKQTFDEYLERREAQKGETQPSFDIDADYLNYVDGKPRHEGVRSFLAARDIDLPEGASGDRLETDTVHALGARKDALFMERMRRDGVEVFGSTIKLICALREQDLKTAVVTSSRNGREVLRSAGIEDLLDMRLDGIDGRRPRGPRCPWTLKGGAAFGRRADSRLRCVQTSV